MKLIQKWKRLSSYFVFDHPWCRIRQDKVELPNGIIIDDFFIHVRPDIALVLPITEQQEIVFVRQYRHGVEQILLELPAGAFNPEKETPEAAALRELTEETGYIAESIVKLATLYDNPVKDTNSVHLFLANSVKLLSTTSLDITEEIEVVLIPIEAVWLKIQTGEICVAGSVAALFLGLNYLQANN
ncbi:NUDIX hydrolase [Planktothrix sp. FACHB-1365]|uniref:NUDIX hydrolase n=1 Tax=Planktothrix sp. FACHB-1365 TaxID=2692855 RepID=UPI001683027F|nr:NUDIX hydrolase [Planktothrix sp. FACHB-1365]MBD2484648.1 NUDIX hydrolase [Planktothrix sp. FACHB-1365]